MPPNPIHTFTATLWSGFLSIRPLHKISHWSEMTKRKVDRMADFHGVALVSSSQGRQACRRPVSAKSALRRALPLQTAWTTLLRRANTCAAMHVCEEGHRSNCPDNCTPRSTNCENWDLVTPCSTPDNWVHSVKPRTSITSTSNCAYIVR